MSFWIADYLLNNREQKAELEYYILFLTASSFAAWIHANVAYLLYKHK